MDDPGDEVAFTALVHLVYLLPLGLAELELHHLFEGLRGDTTEGLAFGCVFPLVYDVSVFVEFLGVDNYLAGFGIDGDPRLFRCARASLVGRDESIGKGIENGVYRHPSLACQHLDRFHHCVELHFSP